SLQHFQLEVTFGTASHHHGFGTFTFLPDARTRGYPEIVPGSEEQIGTQPGDLGIEDLDASTCQRCTIGAAQDTSSNPRVLRSQGDPGYKSQRKQSQQRCHKKVNPALRYHTHSGSGSGRTILIVVVWPSVILTLRSSEPLPELTFKAYS